MTQQNASFSSILQQLSSDHFNRAISRAEYRAKRKDILDKIDQYYNGNRPRVEERDDVTVRNDQRSVSLGTTMTFSVNEVLGIDKKNQ